ncbi:MAG: GH3 auxin-responsive promoter family protein [Clostridia bacterium]|nr:GH3 auxin-responsive promoter family protein [Clostridia bacterium]
MNFSDFGVWLGDISLKEANHYTKIPMKAQEKTLSKIIKRNKNSYYGKKYDFKNIKSIDDFREKLPLTTYADYEEFVDRMIENKENNLMYSGKNIRYCSSSGSVGKPKILPKSVKDLWNMQCFGFSCSVATAAHYLKDVKGIKMPSQMGPLVLILSGHPLSDGKKCNGAGQVPLTYLKPITKFFCTSPTSLLYPEHEELLDTSYLQLRFALENSDVSYLGSIVITLLTTMFDYLVENWQMLCDDIEKGIINPDIKITPDLEKEYSKLFKPNKERADFLRKEFEKGFDTPIAPRIWPKLCWAYGMIGSNLRVYVSKLRKYIGDDVALHNMGYAAAEGFFAMPTELNVEDGVLLPQCIFFEFIPVDDDDDELTEDGKIKTLLIDELEEGKKYEIVISNFSGLYRYRMEDIITVTGFYNNTPRIELLYRRNLSMNVANEKTTTQMVDCAAKQTSEEIDNEFVGHSFYADFSTNPPRYCMLVETKKEVTEEDRQKMIQILDEKLNGVNDKYYKYRRWGMLNDPEVLILQPKTYLKYNDYLRNKGVVLNQIKPVTVINTDERKDFFFSHVSNVDSETIKQWKESEK